MDPFWKWLMRANARWVFYCALAALVLVGAWWTWKEFSPLEQEAAIPVSALKGAVLPTLGFDALLERFESRRPAQVPANVFLAPEPPRPPAPPVDANPPTGPVRQPDPGAKPSDPPPQPPPKQPDTVSLTYRGLFQRTDGKIMALIEDSRSRGSSFYSVSNELFGVRVGAVDTNQATVTRSDGSSVILKLGQPAVFEGGKRGN